MTRSQLVLFHSCKSVLFSSILHDQKHRCLLTQLTISNCILQIVCCPLVLSDFIGVVKSAGDLEYVTFHKTKWQTQLLKPDIEMVDSTNLVAMVTLWDVHAEETNVSNNPVLVIRGAKVSEHGSTHLELFWYRE